MKARPSFEEHKKQRSAGKVSPSYINTIIPTFKSEDFIS
jgi:hypothetical protein